MPRKNKINDNFNFIANELTTIAQKNATIMPLFSKSIMLSVDILKTYQVAFNGIKKKKVE